VTMAKRIELEAGSFVARPYRDDDEARVLELWRVAFGRDLEPAVWRWKYADNPFGRRILLCLDRDDGAALVMYSGVPYRAVWNGRRVEIVQLMDIMSHPDSRKTGLFVKAAEVFFELFAGGDSVLYYGIPGRYHFDIGAKYLKYSELSSGVTYLCSDAAALTRPKAKLGGSVALIDRATPELDRAWSEAKAHYPLAAVRDAAFVDWRFFRHPTRTYQVYVYRSGMRRRVRGYAVIGIEGLVAKLADLMMPADEAMVAALLGGVAARVAAQGTERLETWLPGGHFLARTLEATGWAREPEPLGIVPTARSFGGGLTIPWTAENLYYSMADSDLL
jgi:hypothetical protein